MSFEHIITILLSISLILLIINIIYCASKREKIMSFHASSLIIILIILINSTLELHVTLNIIIALLLTNLVTIYQIKK